MTYEQVIALENDGLNLCAGDHHIYIRHGKYVSQYEYPAMREVTSRQVFKKDGKSRGIYVSGDRLFVRDFCDLYELDRGTLAVTRTWTLGSNASTDICAMGCDLQSVYACIRNGEMKVIHRETGEAAAYPLCCVSAWAITADEGVLYLGTVEGEILAVSKADMRLLRRKQIHKKNIYRVIIEKGLLYTASQDGALQITRAADFTAVCVAPKALTNMTTIAGIHGDFLLTANPNRQALSFWHKQDLAHFQTMPFPTGGLSHQGVLLYENTLFGSNGQGVYAMELA